MKGIQILSIILLTVISLGSTAQDIHFSQFWNAPLLQNPSFAGKSEGDIRAIANHRSQWGSVSSNPFRTFGANFDMRLNTSSTDNHFAGGISMYTDVAGASRMRTTMVNIAAAYHLKINKENYISGGLQGGISQKSIDKSSLRFDNQFDGIGHNMGIDANENLNNLSEVKPSFSAGISYQWSNDFRRSSRRSNQGIHSVNVGLAMHHFNAPNFNFSNKERLALKYISSVNASFGLDKKWSIQPAVYLGLQNKASNFVIGSLFRYLIKEESRMTSFNKSAAIAFGSYFRIGDAIIPAIQVEWASFNLGFSYDVNLSQLNAASNGKGAFEISLKYISLSSRNGRKSRARFK